MAFWERFLGGKKAQVRRCARGHVLSADGSCQSCYEDQSFVDYDPDVSLVSGARSNPQSVASREIPGISATQDERKSRSLSDAQTITAGSEPIGGLAPAPASDREPPPDHDITRLITEVPLEEPRATVGASPPHDPTPVEPTRQPPLPPSPPQIEITRRQSPYTLAPGPVAWLVVATGPRRGCDLRLGEKPVCIGRQSSAQIRLDDDEMVSTRHAEIRLRKGKYLLLDLGSTNGTKVNGRSTDSRELRDGDRVRVGSTDLVFKCVNI